MPKLDQPQKSEEKKVEEKADTLAQKEKELREEEKVPFILAYRDNKLFQEYVPVIEDFLKEQGYPVSIQSFPVGTPPEEIKKWFEEHKSELEGKNILCDNTFDHSTNNFADIHHKMKLYLDDIMQRATRQVMIGPDEKVSIDTVLEDPWRELRQLREKIIQGASPEEQQKIKEVKERYYSMQGEVFKKILNAIPEEKRKQMEIIILKGPYFYKGKGIFPALIEHEPNNFISDIYEENPENFALAEKNLKKFEAETDEFAQRIEQWFNECGISKVSAYRTGAEIPPETMEKLKNGQAYILWDRHADYSFPAPYRGDNIQSEGRHAFWGSYFNSSSEEKNCHDAVELQRKAFLEMPIGNFYSTVREKINFQLPFQEMTEAIKDVLQEKLEERRRFLEESKKKEQ